MPAREVLLFLMLNSNDLSPGANPSVEDVETSNLDSTNEPLSPQESSEARNDADSVPKRRIRWATIDRFLAEDVDDEVLDAQFTRDGRLRDEEILSFISVYFPDEFMSLNAHHVTHSTNPEINRAGQITKVGIRFSLNLAK